MTNTLRNRLVGSIIIAAAGIIIIPSILDGQKASYKDDFKPIPARPEFKSVQSAKTFPAKDFEENLPKPDETISDEVALDIDPGLEPVSSNDVDDSQINKTVLETETLSVATVGKPVDFSNNPLKPKATPKPEPTPAKIAPAKTAPAKTAPAKTAPAKTQAQKVAEKAKASPFSSSAWVIQLGSFGLKANAVALEKKLNAAGFVTFTRQIKNKSRDLTKVYVGPELDKKVLDKALARVNQVGGVKGTITAFTIKR